MWDASPAGDRKNASMHTSPESDRRVGEITIFQVPIFRGRDSHGEIAINRFTYSKLEETSLIAVVRVHVTCSSSPFVKSGTINYYDLLNAHFQTRIFSIPHLSILIEPDVSSFRT